jgi:hypothetical protein
LNHYNFGDDLRAGGLQHKKDKRNLYIFYASIVNMARPQVLRLTAAVILAAGGLLIMRSFGELQLPTVLAYSGVVIFLWGLVATILPRHWSGLPRRVYGVLIGTVLGFALCFAAFGWPVRSITTAAQTSRLDAIMPVYHFHERHEAVVHASQERVREALNQMSFADVGAMQALGRIRAAAMRQRMNSSGKGAPPTLTIIQMIHDPRSGFFPLDESPSELVFGLAGKPWDNVRVRLTPEQFVTWSPSGTVKIAANFRVDDAGGGNTRIVTETRVLASDKAATYKMAKYWALIYPGSGIIRRELLNAVQQRAERP